MKSKLKYKFFKYRIKYKIALVAICAFYFLVLASDYFAISIKSFSIRQVFRKHLYVNHAISKYKLYLQHSILLQNITNLTLISEYLFIKAFAGVIYKMQYI